MANEDFHRAVAERREAAEAAIREGLSQSDIHTRLRAQFGSSVSCNWLTKRTHEMRGTKPMQRKARSLPRRAEPATEPKPAPQRGIASLLPPLVEAMRREGIVRVSVESDGTATIHRATVVRIGGTE